MEINKNNYKTRVYKYDSSNKSYTLSENNTGAKEKAYKDELAVINTKIANSIYSTPTLEIAGNIEKSDQICVAIIGSRHMTDYGRSVCNSIVKCLAKYGITIVSGLMYGVDMTSHNSALYFGGRTICILGYGFNHLHRFGYTKNVVNKILESGCGALISGFNSSQIPDKWTFPERNKIIAAMADAVIVVEAGERSGSLITVGFSAAIGKEVFAVPGSIFSKNSYGTHSVIKEGAVLLQYPEEVIEYLGRAVQLGTEIKAELSKDEQKIYSTIKDQQDSGVLNVSLEKAYALSGMSFAQFNSLIFSMESRGIISVNDSGVALKV